MLALQAKSGASDGAAITNQTKNRESPITNREYNKSRISPIVNYESRIHRLQIHDSQIHDYS